MTALPIKEILWRRRLDFLSFAKLEDPRFVDKAPEAAVRKERDKLSEAQGALSNPQAPLGKVRAL